MGTIQARQERKQHEPSSSTQAGFQLLQTSPARNGKLDGKGGGNKGIDGWEDTVMGSGVSSVRFIWCGAVLWRYGDTYIVKRSR